MLPRERVALLLDPDAPFLELSTLAGFGFDVADAERSIPGGGLIAGIGFVSGMRCMVSANDAGIDAGALQPMGLDKALRAQEIALENKLPYVQLVESAGANLLRYRVEDFVRGGGLFRNLARLSAAGLPVVTVTHGSSTAGGAYQTGLSDYIVMVRGRTRAFLAGPPLLKAATGEIATEEELGGAEMHTRVSGLGDYLAEDDRDALRIAREIMAGLDWDTRRRRRASIAPPLYDAEELLGIMPTDYKRPVDMREVIARIVDGSDFIEFGDNYGPATVCGHARASKAMRSASSPTTARSIPPAPTRPRISSRPAARRARRCSISTTPRATWWARGRGRRHDQARLEDDPGRDQRQRAADHALLRRLVRRRQLRHVRARLPSALLLLLAQRQDRGDGRASRPRRPWRSSPRPPRRGAAGRSSKDRRDKMKAEIIGRVRRLRWTCSPPAPACSTTA